MASDDIPGEFYTPTRDKVVADGKNSFVVRQMSVDPTKTVDISPTSFPAIIAEVFGDMAMPHYANEAAIAPTFLVKNNFGARLDRLAKEKLGDVEGERLPATGGSGFMEATKIEVGGAPMDASTTLIHKPTSQRFRVVEDKTYQDGDSIQIIGISTGPATNLNYGEELQFESQPPGCSLTATVLPQNDGTGVLVGLIGGREGETDVELQTRIIEAQSNPKAAGNAAQVVQVAQRTAGVPVEKAFTYDAWMGPGTSSVAFTLRPDAVSSRIPNSVQRGLVEANLRSAFPLDWSITVPTILTQELKIIVGVTWLASARGWADGDPWPGYVDADPLKVSVVYDSLSMRVATMGTLSAAPVVGQTIALFDIVTKSFKRKRISLITTVTPGQLYDLTFTDALGASDSFVPVVGALVSPWSPSLLRLPAAMLAYTRSLGPGEMFASLPDPGGRRRRWPPSPSSWPSELTNVDTVNAAKASGVLADAEVLLPDTPRATTVGVPGVHVYLQQLTDLAVFPQS
jgi:uncharacterized phage protein gp47/JayE